jgi:hypothetical protein
MFRLVSTRITASDERWSIADVTRFLSNDFTGRDVVMSITKFIAAAAALTIAGSAPAYAQSAGHILRGAGIGAAGGAVAGAVIPGLSVGEGALIGGAGGAVVNSLDKKHRYYRDSRGRKYWVDKHGRRHYK